MMKNVTRMALMGAAAVLVSTQANASGYQLNEYSATNLGRAFAGMGVVGDDYSAIAYNPAGMILKDSGMQIGVSSIQEHSIAKGDVYKPDGTPYNLNNKERGKMNIFKFMPHFFAQHKVNDDLVFGFGVFTPFGLATDYNKHWFGATHGTKTDLEVIDFSPTVAYRFNKLTLGAGWIIRYVHGDVRHELHNMPNSENQMDLDGWSANSWSLGALYEFTQDTRIGFSYRYNNAHTVKGQHNIRGTGMFDGRYHGRSKMTLPASATLSAYHKVNDQWALSATARWAKWDKFDYFVMTTDFPYKSGQWIREDWKNVMTYSIGADYTYNENWTFRGGLAYDRSPIGTKRNRTVRIPDSDRFWVTAGLTYKTGKFQYDLGYSHLFMKTAETLNSNGDTTARVKYKNYSNMLGIQVQYNF